MTDQQVNAVAISLLTCLGFAVFSMHALVAWRYPRETTLPILLRWTLAGFKRSSLRRGRKSEFVVDAIFITMTTAMIVYGILWPTALPEYRTAALVSAPVVLGWMILLGLVAWRGTGA